MFDMKEEAKISMKMIKLLIPYTKPEWDIGYWSIKDKCYRFKGDDGPGDIQPIGWLPYQ